MAGLTGSGFIPETYDNIKSRIESKLEILSPGFDFSPESPDGQLIGIMAFELFQNWSQLSNVYNSYNPQVASGAALRNLGLISGLPYGVANRSFATCEVTGTTGTIIPQGTIVLNDAGEEFYTSFETSIPSNLQVVAVTPGPVAVDANTITTIQSPISGWTTVNNSGAGTVGTLAQTEQEYRNTRQRVVMRNFTSTSDTMTARLLELGLGQVSVTNNDSSTTTLPDGTPPNTIHVTTGEIGNVAPEDIAKVILDTNAIGCPTYGNSSTVVKDAQGVEHEIYYSVATVVPMRIELDVTFLSENIGGAEENIKTALLNHINSLASGEDVVWSRLFGYVTPYAKAQINTITVGKVAGSQGAANVAITDEEFANIVDSQIILTIT